MAKMTLLEIVQNILSSMDSDNVNSIGDTEEASQVAREVQTTYNSMLTSLDFPEKTKIVNLESLSDLARPNFMTVPSGVQQIYRVLYNNGTEDDPEYKDVLYLEPSDFLSKVIDKLEGAVCIKDPDSGGFSMWIQNNAHPSFYTSFNDQVLVFDSYNATSDDTLQSSKSLATVVASPSFELTDSYVPDLDENFFPLLLAEAKNACFVNIKQVSNSNEQVRARRHLTRTQTDKFKTHKHKGEAQVNFGRPSRK